MIDCFNREPIGYAMTGHMRTSLVADAALEMAARNHRLAVDCIFDFAHGTQYTSAEFGAKPASLNIRQSLGAPGVDGLVLIHQVGRGLLDCELCIETPPAKRVAAAFAELAHAI